MRRQLAILGVICVGCFAEEPSDGDDGVAETTGDTASEGTSSGSGSGASMTSVGSSSSTDAATSDAETGMPSCGMLGEACCDGACEQGSCAHQRCVMLAGMYAEPDTCNGCTTEPSGDEGEVPPSTIPYLDYACECPEGFRTAMPLPTTSDYCPVPMVLHTDTDIRFCEHNTFYPEVSDWAGAFATSMDPLCMGPAGDECLAPNLYTDACSCPEGTIEAIADTWAPCPSDFSPEYQIRIHLCINAAVPAVNFGGAYQLRWLAEGGTMCENGNPLLNNLCECGPEFTPQSLRITSPEQDQGGDLFICVN